MSDKTPLTRALGILIAAVSLALALFHVYTAAFGLLTAMWQRSIHLGLGALIVYLIAIRDDRRPLSRAWSALMIAGTVGAVAYLIAEFQGLIIRFGAPNTADLITGALFIIIVLDVARRTVGWVLPAIAGVSLLYAFFGHMLPGILNIRPYTLARVINQVSLTTDGIFGIPLGVSANYIVLFVLFGAVLEATGTGRFYIDLASRAVGQAAGGPAKVAVVASSLFGSISGSAVANVAATGTVTIPLMTQSGYRREFAAAVESVASTGGQIMPPLMGAGAFVMAEMLGVPYARIIGAALVPALIYYGVVFATVHFVARREGLAGGVPGDEPLGQLLRRRGILLLPLVVLIYLLVVVQMSVTKAAVYALFTAIAVSALNPVERLQVRALMEGAIRGAQTALVVIASAACAGIVIGVISLTGIGLKFSSAVVAAGGGNLTLVLFFMMLAALFLGMGLPTTPAYLIMAVLGAPSLVRMGVHPIAAHMFVFYFGCISMITPPVALAVYTASTMAAANFWRTSWHAVTLGLTAFIVPYMFVYSPALIGEGSLVAIVSSGITALVGAVSFGAGVAGWALTRCSVLERVLLIAGGLGLIDPGTVTNALGAVAIAVALLLQWRTARAGSLSARPSKAL